MPVIQAYLSLSGLMGCSFSPNKPLLLKDFREFRDLLIIFPSYTIIGSGPEWGGDVLAEPGFVGRTSTIEAQQGNGHHQQERVEAVGVFQSGFIKLEFS